MLGMADTWGTVIGAGAVIAGATLTGGFTLLKGRQERAEKERERLEQRVVRHREIRRDAYVALLSKTQEMDELIAEYSNRGLEARAEYRERLGAAETKLYQCLAVVQMEGPAEVARCAKKLVVEYVELCRLTVFSGVTIVQLMAAHTSSTDAQNAFIAATARTLDSER